MVGIGGLVVAVWGFVAGMTAAKFATLAFHVATGGLFLVIGVALTGLILIIQDFILWLNNGRSAFGKFYEAMANPLETLTGLFEKLLNMTKEFFEFIGLDKKIEMPKEISTIHGKMALPANDDPYALSLPKNAHQQAAAQTKNTNNKVHINLNLEGVPTAEQGKVVADTVKDQMAIFLGYEYREAARDGAGVLAQ